MKRKILLSFALVFVSLFLYAETVIHNGIVYGTVVSPYTGRVWLDRNLGASRVCTALDDYLCYGDYYQWGRGADGHEKKDSNTTAILATNIINVGHESFITSSIDSDYDWALVDSNGTDRSKFWSLTDGSGVCPVGYYVPTKEELSAETTDVILNYTSSEAFNSFLKLPSAGFRQFDTGELKYSGIASILWSSTMQDSSSSDTGTFNDSESIWNNYRANGRPVRCIKDKNTPPLANAGENKTIYSDQNITLSASQSSDSDGEIIRFEWFENSTLLSSEENITLSGLDAGEHIFTLRVTDNDGLSDEANVTVTVLPPPSLWLIDGLDENITLISGEKFYREFWVYANSYYTTSSNYPISDYSTDNIRIVVEPETLRVECEDRSYPVKPQMRCSLSGVLSQESDVALIIADETHAKTEKITFTVSFASQTIAHVNAQESSLIVTGGIVTHAPKIGFDILGDNISQEPRCFYADINGKEHILTVKKISDIRYVCDGDGLFTASEVQSLLNNSDFNITISQQGQSVVVPVETFIRDEKRANAVLEYACEYEYMRISNEEPYVSVNGTNFPIFSGETCSEKKFYLGGDVTDSSRNKDTVVLHRGIWKLYAANHVHLINVDDSELVFDVDGGDLLDNEKLLKFQTEPSSKYAVTLKRWGHAIASALSGGTIFNNPDAEKIYDFGSPGTLAVRGTTLQIVKEVDKKMRFNLIEGGVEVRSSLGDQNVSLVSMESFDMQNGKVEPIVEDVLTPLDIEFLNDTGLNGIDSTLPIGKIRIATNHSDVQYLLLGLNVRYGSGRVTVFDSVAAGAYGVHFLKKMWHKTPENINVIIDANHLEYSFDLVYQKVADVYVGDRKQADTVKIETSTGTVSVDQNDNEQIVVFYEQEDANASILFDTLESNVSIDTDKTRVVTKLNLPLKMTLSIEQNGTISIDAGALIIPTTLPRNTKVEVVGSNATFTIALDGALKF